MSKEHRTIDLTSPLMDLSVVRLVRLANLAMNRLTLRDWGEIAEEIGVRIEMRMANPAAENAKNDIPTEEPSDD